MGNFAVIRVLKTCLNWGWEKIGNHHYKMRENIHADLLKTLIKVIYLAPGKWKNLSTGDICESAIPFDQMMLGNKTGKWQHENGAIIDRGVN